MQDATITVVFDLHTRIEANQGRKLDHFTRLFFGKHFNLIINATSAGLEGELPPFPVSILSRDTVCYDLSYSMRDTPFVEWARNNGCKQVYQGWGMLIEQAAESFAIWRGIRPDTRGVRERLP